MRITRNAVQASLNRRFSDNQRLYDEISDPGSDMEKLADSSLSPKLGMEDFVDSSLSLAEVFETDSDAGSNAVDNSFTSQITGKHQEHHHLVEEFVMTLPDVPCESDSKSPELENILEDDID